MKTRIAVVVIFLLVMVYCAPVTKKGSEEEFATHINAGIRFLQQENYSVAKREFTEALSINPNSIRANNLMGMTYFKEQNYDSAETYFQKAVKLDPNYVTGYINLGGIYAMKELYPRAREYYEKALAISPQSASACYSLGAIWFQLGNQEKGIYYLTKGMELDPDFLEKHADSLAGLPMKGSVLPELHFTYAKLFALRGDIERTAEYLKKARQFGFKDWKRIQQEKEFELVREDPRIKEFLK
jgi:tetratricopeptide (TPR) repeat protein